ncbi:MAG: hypothetical protein AB8B73_06515 [Ekhidna sp.]
MREVIFGLSQLRVKAPPSSFLCRWLLTSLILIPFIGFSQNLRCKTIPTNQEFQLDTVLIEPESITIENHSFNTTTQSIFVKEDQDSVKVCYRVLSSLLTKTYSNRAISNYDPSGDAPLIVKKSAPIEKEELFQFEGIQKYGAITRGVSFGNRQNLFVNSSLNLQMEGKVDDNLNVSAVITDQNVPYQPEGNTQQIRDFDNVFIKLYNDDFDVIAGDIVLQDRNDESYFLKYYKNAQGLQASYRGETGNWKYETKVSGALSKGKFSSAIVPAIDGLAGPYKLRGPNGERFIIVLANSEKVFLDGKLLQRGFDRDYVIDYNLGEITFNNHIIITQFSIIRVDFEYSEQFYSRTNLSAYQSIENEKIKVFTNYYRERDNPNNNFGFSLNENDISQLQTIGDDIDQAFITGFDSVLFDQNRILYIKKDTIDQDGNIQTIFMYSTDETKELFSPTFSDVGIGNGNYLLSQLPSNGKVYEWVSPISGISQGNYEPGAFIPLPNSRQMLSSGINVKLTDYETIKAEVAVTNTDLNLYSDIDDTDNSSMGYFAQFETKGRPSFIDGYKWTGSFTLEYDQKDFTFIDRYRPILFDREWSFDPSNSENDSDDLIFFAKVGVEKNALNSTSLYLNRRERGGVIDGWQRGADFVQEFKGFQINSSHFHLTNDQFDSKSKWLKSKTDISYGNAFIRPGYIFEIDENTRSQQDSIISSLMHFRSHEFYLSNRDSSESNYRVSYQLREDKLPLNGKMEDYLKSQNWNARYTNITRKSTTTLDINYRRVNDKLLLNEGEDEIISSRFNRRGSFLKKHIMQNFSFSTGNSRELKREFIYLPVNTGEGTHTWRDNNDDGIQDLNEFFEAINPDERNFAKIFTPTDEYITSFQTFYITSIDAKMPGKWRSDSGIKLFLSKLSGNFYYNVNYKTTSRSLNDRLNPFAIRLADEDVLFAQNAKRYTLFYNRNGRGFAGDFTFQDSDNKQLLVQGFELRERKKWINNFKINLSKEYTLRMTASFENFLNTSNFLDSRNFEINSYSYFPQIIWQPTNSIRVIGSFERETKNNDFVETSDESALLQTIRGELTWSQASKGSLRGSFSLINIDFSGDTSTYLAYLLLDALQPGSNQTWQVNWQQKISRGMQLSLNYNGRKSEKIKPIHTGGVTLTAFF